VSVEGDLKKATNNWSAPLLVRTYEDNQDGQKKLQADAGVMTAHGYEPQMQTQDGGHVHAGRLILTGGLSIFAGKRGIRSGGKISITYKKQTAGDRAAVAGFAPQGEFEVFWSALDGLNAGQRLIVGLSDFELALLDSAGQPQYRVRLAEVGTMVEPDAGVRVWRGSENLFVLRPVDGRPLGVLVDAVQARQPRAAPASTAATAPQPAAAAQPDVADQLRKLGDLRDAGILTDEEFTSKKTELLARL
jgi:hypothetical protein